MTGSCLFEILPLQDFPFRLRAQFNSKTFSSLPKPTHIRGIVTEIVNIINIFTTNHIDLKSRSSYSSGQMAPLKIRRTEFQERPPAHRLRPHFMDMNRLHCLALHDRC